MDSHVDLVNIAEKMAKKTAMSDRLCYAPYFEAAERFICDNNLVIGGEMATLLLLGEQPGPDDFYYEMYSSNAFSDARTLSDKLFAVGVLGYYTYMRTEIPHKEFAISVNERVLFRVKGLAERHKTRPSDALEPAIRPANFAKKDGKPLNLLCAGAEIQLTSVYTSLCNPAQAKAWPRLLRIEEKLRRVFAKETNIQGKNSKATFSQASLSAPSLKKEGGGKQKLAPLTKAILDKFATGEGRVLLSETPRLQIISLHKMSSEESEIKRIAKASGFNVQGALNNLNLPTDPRLQKTTLYAKLDSRRVPFMDIFDLARYEVVPVVAPQPRKLKKATHFARLRFHLVNMWTIRLLFRMKVTKAEYTAQLLRSAIKDFNKAAQAYVAARDSASRERDFDRLLPTSSESYVGFYEDPIIARKRHRFKMTSKPAKSAKRRFYPPYYPARASNVSTRFEKLQK